MAKVAASGTRLVANVATPSLLRWASIGLVFIIVASVCVSGSPSSTSSPSSPSSDSNSLAVHRRPSRRSIIAGIISYVLLQTPAPPTSRCFTEGDDEDQEDQMIANLLSCSSPPIWVVAAPFRGSRETIRTIQRASQGYIPSCDRLASGSCCPSLLCVCVVCVAVVCGVC